MLKQIKLVDTKKGLDRYDFQYKCTFCKVLTKKIHNNSCNFCFKYFNYVDETNVCMFSVKNIFADISHKKFENNVSCFKFKKMEQFLVEISENNPCFSYNQFSMNWHVDFGFDPNNKDQINTIFKTVETITSEVCELASMKLAEKSSCVDDIINKMDVFDKNRNIKLPIYMPVNNLITPDDHKTPVLLMTMNRSNIFRNFYEDLFLEY